MISVSIENKGSFRLSGYREWLVVENSCKPLWLAVSNCKQLYELRAVVSNLETV